MRRNPEDGEKKRREEEEKRREEMKRSVERSEMNGINEMIEIWIQFDVFND